MGLIEQIENLDRQLLIAINQANSSFLDELMWLISKPAFGIPFYICASASTPIAASMMMKGMSPGVALIFLLVGPATNFTNLAVIQKYLGKRGVFINVVSIALVSLILSFIVDGLYDHYNWIKEFKIEEVSHQHGAWYEHFMASFLLILIIKGIYKEKVKPLFNKNSSNCCG